MDEKTILHPIYIRQNNNYIEYRYMEDDELIHKTEINHFEEKDGVTIQNIEYPVPAYYVHLYTLFGKTLSCGNIINTFFAHLKAQKDNILLIIDFDGVNEVSENFCAQYYKHLLTTKNKLITINKNTQVSNIFARFIVSNAYDASSKDKTLLQKTSDELHEAMILKENPELKQ